MKKIAKLTWLHNGNFGSVLQAVALQRYLVDQGYDVTDLDYNASLKEKLKNWLVNKNSPKLFVGKFEEASRKKRYKNPEKFEGRSKKFADFEKQWIKRSSLCSSPVQIGKVAQQYDIFICGSDQIWSPALMNPVFYLNFVPDDKKKIAYAPSFGNVGTTEEKRRKIAGLLNSFDDISVRETQGQEFIKQLTGKEVPVVLDPTFLLEAKVWQEYVNELKKTEPYIFCYLLTPNQEYIHAISKFANAKGLQVIIVLTSKGPFNTGFKEVVDIGPAEWLGLIKNAAYVCTDSFHGCIFSSIFHKEYILFKRFKDEDKVSENSRIYTLAKMLDVEDRIIDENCIDKIKELGSIEFDKIDQIIENRANESKKWLLDALSKAGA